MLHYGLTQPDCLFFFFFQAEDGIRDLTVTGVQTCALPICTWRDGWRHLRFMLLFSPRWLFLYPGMGLFAIGLVTGLWLETGPKRIGPFGFDIHTLLLAGFCCLIGYQLIVFPVFTKGFAMRMGFYPTNPYYAAMFRYVQLETGLVLGA